MRVLLFLGAFVAFYANAAATLVVPGNIDLEVLNMKKAETDGGLLSTVNTIKLTPGWNQIVFRYIPRFEGKKEIRQVYSDTIIAKFYVQGDEQFKFTLPDFKRYQQARENISPLQWGLVTKDGKNVAIKQDILPIGGFAIGEKYITATKKYNIHGGVAAIAVKYVVTQPKNEADSPAVNTSSEDSQLLDLWKTMYYKATPAQQKAMKNWLLKQ